VTVALSELPWEVWQPTKETLHLYAQIVGKVKLAVAPPRNHWWHVTLLPDAHGLTTGPLRNGDVTFDIAFDFVQDALVVRTSGGEERRVPLVDGLAVADFDGALHAALRALDLDVEIVETPFATPVSDVPFPEDRGHATYDPDGARRFWRATDWAAGVLEEFSGWFCGKQSPVHVFWHGFDLAMARYSGRLAPEGAGVDHVTREAYSREVIACGFWSGDADTRQAAFYSYTAPEPTGLAAQRLAPAAARWQEAGSGHLALLPYDAVRTSTDARATVLAFLQSAYVAGATAADWELDELTSSFCPAPERLESLVLRA
jgi:hypothetical protein